MTGSESYNDLMIDHYKNPRNFGRIDNPNISYEESNSLCGDKINIQVKIEDNKIKHVMFEGRGCAISIAATSILTEMLMGKSLAETKVIKDDQLLNELKIPIKKPRLNCALLGLKAFRKLLNQCSGLMA